MSFSRMVAILGVSGLILLPGRTAAQDQRISVTGYAGSAAYGSLADSADPGVLLAPGGFNGGMAELWLGRFGLRLHAGFADTHVDGEPGTGFGIVAGDVDVLLRFRHPRPGLIFQPYGLLGLGAVRYDLGLDTTLVGGYAYESNPAVRGTFVLGIGADFFDGPVGLKLELMDIIAGSSPLSRTDTSHFGAVSHVVLTLGLSIRGGRIDLPPPPAPRPRPVPVRTRPRPQQDTAAVEPDSATARPDTTAPDTARIPIRRPDPPPIDTTVSIDTASVDTAGPGRLTPQPPDTTRKPPPIRIAPPTDTTEPPDTTRVEPPDTAPPPMVPVDSGPRRPPVVRPPAQPPVDTTSPGDTTLAPPPRPTPPPVDTTSTVDTTRAPPPRPTPPPVDTTSVVDTTDANPPPVDTTGGTEPPDTSGTEPPDTTAPPVDTTDVRGRLFTVRVSWDPDDAEQGAAMDALVTVLEEAGVPVGPVEDEAAAQPGQGRGGGPAGDAYRRVAALRNAADARTLGNHIEAEYGLGWEWVHIDRDEDVPAAAVAASEAFVAGLPQGPGNQGRGGGGGGGGGGPGGGR